MDNLPKGRPLSIDAGAECFADRPAFISAPEGALVSYSFVVLDDVPPIALRFVRSPISRSSLV